MSTVKCSACEEKASITFCSETGMALCGDCAVPCDGCSIPIGRKQAQITSTGRSLCPRCMAERNAKRKLKREKMKAASRARKRAERGETVPDGPEPQATHMGAPASGSPLSPAPMSFDALSAGAPASPSAKPVGSASPVVRGRSFEAPEEQHGSSAAPATAETAEDDAGSDVGAGFGVRPGAAKDAAAKRDFGLEGVPTDRSARLELPPIDEKRPVMVMSGHQAPTRTAYYFAFAFFGIAGLVFYSTTPILQDIMFPFDTPGYKFDSNQLPLIKDTNQLRNTSNISQLDLLSQVPAFFITWAILIVYLGGSVLIIVSTARSAISSIRSNRELRKAQKKKQGDPFSSLSGR